MVVIVAFGSATGEGFGGVSVLTLTSLTATRTASFTLVFGTLANLAVATLFDFAPVAEFALADVLDFAFVVFVVFAVAALAFVVFVDFARVVVFFKLSGTSISAASSMTFLGLPLFLTITSADIGK